MKTQSMPKLFLGGLLALAGGDMFGRETMKMPKTKPQKFNYRSKNTAFVKGKRHASQRRRANRRK